MEIFVIHHIAQLTYYTSSYPEPPSTTEPAWIRESYTDTRRKSKSKSHSAMSDSLRPLRLYRPWNFPGQNTGVGSLSFLQGIFPTQGLNPGLLHCRWILYQLSHQGSPRILEWVAYPFPGDLPDPGIKPGSPALQASSLPAELWGKPISHILIPQRINSWLTQSIPLGTEPTGGKLRDSLVLIGWGGRGSGAIVDLGERLELGSGNSAEPAFPGAWAALALSLGRCRVGSPSVQPMVSSGVLCQENMLLFKLISTLGP